MRAIKNTIFIGLLVLFAAGSCTDKKLENNIKSLEKRVAALEGKSGVSSSSSSANSTTVAASGTEFPVMSFESTEYDFGTVSEGEIVDYTFKFTNTGNQPLIINKATATCGCTVPDWPKEPIAVGGKGEIKIKFDSKNRKNLQTKYVNINANTQIPVTRLKITGNVLAADNNG